MRKLLVILLLFTFASCMNGAEAPPNLIDRDTFVNVLTEVQILESAYNQKYVSYAKVDSAMLSHYKEIFTRFEVDAAAFEASMSYYRSDRELIGGIYDEVISKLTQMEDQYKGADQIVP